MTGLPVRALGARALGVGERQDSHAVERAVRLQHALAGLRLPAAAARARRARPLEADRGRDALRGALPDITGAESFQTTTNVADEREYFTFHAHASARSTVHWRVRAIRYIDDADVLKNGLPRASLRAVEPDVHLGQPADGARRARADRHGLGHVGQDGPARATPHELTPGFAWTPSSRVLGDVGAVGSSLYRVYIFTDDHCVNQVFAGSIVGSPAFAPRTFGGTFALPQDTKTLADWIEPAVPRSSAAPRATRSTRPARKVSTLERSAGAAGARLRSRSSGRSADASVDLWDSGWPNGRYYWTVVPVDRPAPYGVSSIRIERPADRVPRRRSAAGRVRGGRGMSFGKVSQPVVTAASNAPWVSGLAPNGRVIASAAKVPALHDSPLVAWEPAVGATTYEIQLSRKTYPWKTTWSTTTPATSIVLPLGKKQSARGTTASAASTRRCRPARRR